MDVSHLYSGSYLRADSFENGDKRFTVERVAIEDVGDEGNKKAVVFFEEIHQGLVLNKTNFRILVDVFGKDTDGWIGKQLILRREKTSFQGKLVACIRIHILKEEDEPPF